MPLYEICSYLDNVQVVLMNAMFVPVPFYASSCLYQNCTLKNAYLYYTHLCANAMPMADARGERDSVTHNIHFTTGLISGY